MPIGSLFLIVAFAGGQRANRGQLFWGNWAATGKRPDVVITFDANGGYTLLTVSKGKDYIERGTFEARKNQVVFHIQSSVINVPPPGPPNIGVPFPQRPVPSIHSRTWRLGIRWIDAHHFKGDDGRVYTARMSM